ncbi:DUF4123 domain-containing protein [Photobacterium swingsii]|uniref:DUF4123 domain-containing protein n=1 Tax=Photobacterium swingsii TaxID=680026 RepID=UPI0040693EA1
MPQKEHKGSAKFVKIQKIKRLTAMPTSLDFLTLTEAEHLYILLDASLITNLERKLNELGDYLNATPVYQGTTLHHLSAMSAWLVEILPTEPSVLINWAIDNQYFDNAAWLFTSNQKHKKVLRHFHSLLFVKHPDNSDYIFRFHDPRVARALLQSHYLEGENKLAQPVNTAWFYTSNNWDSINLTSWQIEKTQPIKNQYYLTEQDLTILANVTMTRFIQKLNHHIHTYFPDWYADVNRTPTHQLIVLAKQLGFTSERSTFFFTNVLGYLGEGVIKHRHYQDIHDLLTKTSRLTPEQRAEKAAELAHYYHQGQHHQGQYTQGIIND